ncbi:MAG TPA: class I SAM-dependent methyltransferase [Terriglobia bacterium]|jgi:methyltransferase (TIGR00027 family)|nr:class I SAM-dependent methyltransferase [Terriglobia bacterium]
MLEGRPSATAWRVAVRRAAHQVLDRPAVFEDPLALAMIGADEAAKLASGLEELSPSSRSLRAFLAARSRYAEDQVAHAVRRGVRQYVVLGAGLDTFAYRNPYPDLRVFEVDHPATQEWKRRRLDTARISVPDSVAFAPVDFSRETLDVGLARAGFALHESAFFSWLGVTPYLTRDTVLATFQLIITLSAENGVVFDYTLPRSALGWLDRRAFDALARRVQSAGEPFQGFFQPDELAEELRRMGFLEIEDFDAAKINSRYFKDRADGLCVKGALGRLISAWRTSWR